VKVALEHVDMFAGLVLVAPAFIITPRWLSTSSSAVGPYNYCVILSSDNTQQYTKRKFDMFLHRTT